MQFHRCAARKPTACIQIQGKIVIKINHRTETKNTKIQKTTKKIKKHQQRQTIFCKIKKRNSFCAEDISLYHRGSITQ